MAHGMAPGSTVAGQEIPSRGEDEAKPWPAE